MNISMMAMLLPAQLSRCSSFCVQARNNFYKCVRDLGIDFTGKEVPDKCKEQRAAFEQTCLPSWVSAKL